MNFSVEYFHTLPFTYTYVYILYMKSTYFQRIDNKLWKKAWTGSVSLNVCQMLYSGVILNKI